MNTVDEFFSKEPPSDLYHYTGIGSLLGIADSKCLFASHAYYLNDSREVKHAAYMLQRIVMSLIHQGLATEATVKEFLYAFMDWLITFENQQYNVFIFSFSVHRSQLSQWRSYTPHGKGVSLGFSPHVIQKIAESSGCSLAECLYTSREQEDLADALVKKMLETFYQRVDSLRALPQPTRYTAFLEEFRGDVLRALCILKDPAFSEEREWRLISPYYANYVLAPICYREGASMLSPFIKLDLPEERPLFSEVLLGPSEHQNLSMQALVQFLSKHSLTGAVVNSGVPYREWHRR